RACGRGAPARPRKPSTPCAASSPVVARQNSADGEAVLAAGIFPGRLDVVDAGAGRAPAAPRDHRLDRVAPALEDRLEGAVWPVRDPAGDAERPRPPPRFVTEEDTLDAAADDDVRTPRVLSRQSPPPPRGARTAPA